jgi:cytochrome c556
MRIVAIALIVLSVFSAVAGFAHSGATGIVKKRMDAMTEMKTAMAVIGKMLNGRTVFDRAKGRASAGKIAKHASNMLVLYPDNAESRQKVSKARNEIWTDWERFESMAQDLHAVADELKVSFETGKLESVRPVFRKTGKSCSACHQDFRESDG